MSGNSLQLLLAWMEDHPAHGDWDFIAALTPEHFNQSLLAGHVRQLSESGGGESIDARIPVNNITHHLLGYHLGAPELQLSKPSYEAAHLPQRIAVAGGVHVLHDALQGVLGVSAHDSLDPLWLHQTLDLVNTGQSLAADLALSDDLELSVGASLLERRAGGAFFKVFFSALPPALRVQSLVEFAASPANGYLGSRKIGLRTHASAADGQLAVVLFAALEHGAVGAFPAQGSNFPFLLTDEQGDDTPATVLLTGRLLHRAAFAHAVEHLLEGGQFTYEQEADMRVGMRASQGVLKGQGAHHDSRDFSFESSAISVAAGVGTQPLRVDLLESHAQLQWQAPCTLDFRYRLRGSGGWIAHTVSFEFDLKQRFDLFKPGPGEAAGSMLLGQVLWPVSDVPEVSNVVGLPQDMSAVERAQIDHFLALAIKQAILERLMHSLTAKVPEQLLAQVHLARYSQFASRTLEMPSGTALLGSMQLSDDTLHITERYRVLAAGDRHRFRIADGYPGEVSWSVALVSGSHGQPGSIDAATGEYRAPPAHAMEGNGVRVLVTATDTTTKARSTSLVDALRQRITVNPLIRVCSVGDEVSLSAGTLGGELQWAIAEPKPGSGTLRPTPGQRGRIYVAAAQLDDVGFLVDEVRVTGAEVDGEVSCHLLVQQREPLLQVDYSQPSKGALQLQAKIMGQPIPDGVQWQMPIGGPGQVTEDGRYYPDSNDPAHYVLITATYELPEPIGTAFGYLILPLHARWDLAGAKAADTPQP